MFFDRREKKNPVPFQNKRQFQIRLFIRGQGKLATVWKRIIDEADGGKPALVLKIPLLWIFFNRIPLTILFNNFLL